MISRGPLTSEDVRLALVNSPFERGLRASESGMRMKVVPCARCQKAVTEPGSAYCGPYCEAYADITAFFAEDDEVKEE